MSDICRNPAVNIYIDSLDISDTAAGDYFSGFVSPLTQLFSFPINATLKALTISVSLGEEGLKTTLQRFLSSEAAKAWLSAVERLTFEVRSFLSCCSF